MARASSTSRVGKITTHLHPSHTSFAPERSGATEARDRRDLAISRALAGCDQLDSVGHHDGKAEAAEPVALHLLDVEVGQVGTDQHGGPDHVGVSGALHAAEKASPPRQVGGQRIAEPQSRYLDPDAADRIAVSVERWCDAIANLPTCRMQRFAK